MKIRILIHYPKQMILLAKWSCLLPYLHFLGAVFEARSVSFCSPPVYECTGCRLYYPISIAGLGSEQHIMEF